MTNVAVALGREQLVTMDRGGRVHVPGGDVLGAYRHFQSMRGLLASSIRASTYNLERFEGWLGASLLSATSEDITRWLDSRYPVARTRYCQVSTLHAFYEWAEAEGLVDEDPTRRVIRPRLRHYAPRPISDEGLTLALAHADPTMRAWLCLGAFMGLRCQEIASLRVEDVLWDRSMLLVYLGKGHHQRLVPLNLEVEEALRLIELPRNGPAFRRTDGKAHTPSQVSKYINEHLRSVGVRATAHQLRHWFGTQVYAETHDLRLVQEMLGHASPTTTAIYVAFSPGRAAAVVRNLNVNGG